MLARAPTRRTHHGELVKNRSAPSATVTRILIYEDVGQAIEWLCRVFGFTERLRVERDGVTYHGQLRLHAIRRAAKCA